MRSGMPPRCLPSRDELDRPDAGAGQPPAVRGGVRRPGDRRLDRGSGDEQLRGADHDDQRPDGGKAPTTSGGAINPWGGVPYDDGNYGNFGFVNFKTVAALQRAEDEGSGEEEDGESAENGGGELEGDDAAAEDGAALAEAVDAALRISKGSNRGAAGDRSDPSTSPRPFASLSLLFFPPRNVPPIHRGTSKVTRPRRRRPRTERARLNDDVDDGRAVPRSRDGGTIPVPPAREDGGGDDDGEEGEVVETDE